MNCLQKYTSTTLISRIRGAKKCFSTKIEDPFCDPKSPKVLKFDDIQKAYNNIQDGVVRTACRKSRNLSKIFDMDLFLKLEVIQETGSFKERGARNALINLSEEQKRGGVYAASAGNHALALSLHGKSLGVDINVVMPEIAPLLKIGRCKNLGANVLVEGADIGASREIALRMAHTKNGTYINGFDHYDILAGAGTIGIEIAEQASNIDAVLVPIGGGGLVAGVATAIKTLSPNTKIIGVVSETCQAVIRSFEADKPVYTPTQPTLADGLAVPGIGVNAFASMKGKIDELISVPENDIAVGILRLIDHEKIVCEGAGAISIGALLSGKLDHLKGQRVVSILTGGNIDSTLLGRCIERALAHDNRIIRVAVIIHDKPNGLANLTKIIGDSQGNIRDLYLERAYLRNDMSSQRVKMIVEVRGKHHEREIMGKLDKMQVLEKRIRKKTISYRFGSENCSYKTFRKD